MKRDDFPFELNDEVVERILKFDTLRPSGMRSIIINGFLGIYVVVTGYWYVSDPSRAMLSIFAFFALGFLAALSMTVGGRLRVDMFEKGFRTIRLFRERLYRWDQVSKFEAHSPWYTTRTFVYFTKTDEKGRTSRIRLPDGLAAGEAGGGPQTVALVMNTWRERALGLPHGEPKADIDEDEDEDV